MNPNFGSMVAVFSAPRSSIRPVTARFGGAERRSQHMHIKYMFIVQRYGLMPALAAGFCTAIAVSDRASGGAAIRKVGAAKSAADQIVEDAAPGVAALPARGLDRVQTF
jgi:hypothetical protein